MATHGAQFYTPLNKQSAEIRLLIIAPAPFASNDDQSILVECRMYTTSLKQDPPPEYNALSYAWGDPTQLTEIIVNGVIRKVTINLATALRCIRDEKSEVTLWADAVCINQEDLKERKEQVQQMELIYRTASEVIAWIGEESTDSDLAFSWIKELITIETHSKKDFETISREFPVFLDGNAHDAVRNLGERPYWSRLWILQEIVLGKKVMVTCSKTRLSYYNLYLALETWFEITNALDGIPKDGRESTAYLFSFELLSNPMARMVGLVWIITEDKSSQKSTKPQISTDILYNTSILKAQDGHDQFYGLLGVISLKLPSGEYLQPDYTISVDKLYCEACVALVLEFKSLELVIQAPIRRSKDIEYNLPSWVPNFHVQVPHLSIFDLSEKQFKYRSRSNHYGAINFSNENNILHVQGRVIDHVCTIYPEIFNLNQKNQRIYDLILIYSNPLGFTFIKALRSLLFYRSIDFFDDDNEKISLFLRAIVDIFQPPTNMPDSESLEEYLARAFIGPEREDLVESLVDSLLIYNDEDTQRKPNPTSRIVKLIMAGRGICFTTTGAIALCPVQTEVGDVVTYLADYPLPVLLCKDSDHYMMRGECFLLDEDLMEMINDESGETTVFEIH